MTLEKKRSSCTLLCSVHRNSQLFKNALCCYSFVRQNEHINWIHHFRCACHCKLFFNLNLLLHTHHSFFSKYHSVCTSQPPIIWWETSVQMLYSHNDLNRNSNTNTYNLQAVFIVSDTNEFINFWLQSMATQGKRHNS